MIQGYEDGTNKDEIPVAITKCEESNAPSVATYLDHNEALEPAPKRPKLCPTIRPTAVPTTQLTYTIQRPAVNHAVTIQQVRGITVSAAQLPPSLPVTGKVEGLSIHSTNPTVLQTHLVVAAKVPGVTVQPGTATEHPTSTVSSLSLTQLLLSESPASKISPTIATLSSAVKSTTSPISQKPLTSSRVNMSPHGPEIASLLRQHVPPPASVMMVQSGDVTSVHSYSLVSASASATPHGCLLPMADGKAVLAPNVLRTSPVKRQQTVPHCGETSLVYNIMWQIASCVSKLNKTSQLNNPSKNSLASEKQDVKFEFSIPNQFAQNRPKIKPDTIAVVGEELAKRRDKTKSIITTSIQPFRVHYYSNVVEFFFLKTGGNMMDFPAWVSKGPSAALIEYLRANLFNCGWDNELKHLNDLISSGILSVSPMVPSTFPGISREPVTSNSAVSNLTSSHSQALMAKLLSTPPNACSRGLNSTTMTTDSNSIKSPKYMALSPKLAAKHNSLSAAYDFSIGSQEEIVERAKQEAYVMQRIGDLRKDGLWSLKKLPKVQETARSKGHWDYLLEEMAWLATDFVQERKWKKAAAKKCARMVLKYFQEKDMRAEKAEKEQNMRLRRIASFAAKEIRNFWANIEKLVEYKQQTWLDAKKKKVLDSHLNFIVDQTEKYSSWLTQGLNRQVLESTGTSRACSPSTEAESSKDSPMAIDAEFRPESSESDNEETIDKEEALMSDYDEAEEVRLLKAESELSLEHLLETLPKEVLEKPASLIDSDSNDDFELSTLNESPAKDDLGKTPKNGEEEDEEFKALSSDDDDEETLMEQEEQEKGTNYEEELKELQDENELSVEALYAKYKDAYASDFELSNSESEDDMDVSDEDSKDVSINENSTEALKGTEDTADKKDKDNMFNSDDQNPSKEITDIAATAESLKPLGNTLSTTQVCTKIPFLLKHQLREYQHIGLDWLNAMYEKKLNGILADEMGLGKTIQTISILAHLACEKGIWGPHLIVVPTSVMLNWEMEIKKWCPAFKILTYYGTPKERKQKRIGWTKPNTFHICITSYKLVVQDHQSFRRKKWIYLILDEAQHIKNFKSQRWQMLLNFQSTHRLLLTGTPLQNNLMELWSLMHFLMPNVFQSHRDFREWFVNPVTGMIEGNHEYNESLIKRLHKVLRPFLLRRLKCEVEKQLPKKYEHVVMCRLSKRQRYLYDDFMGQTKTKETLATGNFMSVINILMQLRKVCNHPNMFDPRPIASPFMMSGITYQTASRTWSILDYEPFRNVSLSSLNLHLVDIELTVTAFAAHRTKKFQIAPAIIEAIDSAPDPPPPVPAGKIRLTITGTSTQVPPNAGTASMNHVRQTMVQPTRTVAASGVNRALPPFNTSLMHPQRYMTLPSQPNSAPSSRAVSPVAAVSGQQVVNQTSQSAEYTLQLLQQSSGGLPVAQLAPIGNQVVTSTPSFTVQIPAGARMPLSIGRLVQTSSGQHLLITPSVPTVTSESQPSSSSIPTTVSYSPIIQNAVSGVVPSTSTANVAMATVLPQMQKCLPPMQSVLPNLVTFTRPQNVLPSSTTGGLPTQTVYNKPIGRVAPMNIHPPSNPVATVITNQIQSPSKPVIYPVSRSQPKPKLEVPAKARIQSKRDSLFHLETLAARQAETRMDKLRMLGQINILRCSACPVYGRDLIEAVTVTDSVRHSKTNLWGGRGYVNCLNAPFMSERPRSVLHYTKHLCNLIKTPESYINDLSDIIKRFVFVIPSVTSPPIQLHVSHPPTSKLNGQRLFIREISTRLSAPCALVHPIVSAQRTQFPELRLIEYDCGKLQRLAHLLYELKSGSHRVLIFTQMTRMLDILEQFLSHHGHTYLRLDGSTKIEMRQALMDRFNNDKRVFCFILSTRSGGVGVNLTGADTVIFYDSDWNPTMDAQAQDRCHRIGQTRDVHIYRLISERTIEENILKKANQKRMLGDLAIEGGNFTTAFFKSKTLHDLFGLSHEELTPKIEVISEDLVAELHAENPENFSQTQLEQALGMAEEELDLQAANIARDEAAAELAEFDESIPYDNDSRDNEDKSPAEEELDRLMEQLTPIERYAVRFYESLQDPVSLEQLKQAEEEIEAQKKDWELGRLKALQEEQERRANQESLLNNDDPLLCYGRDSVSNQVFISVNRMETMPMWAPPTPPQDDNDLYIDYNMAYMYEQTVMPESHLPPVFIKKENKRLKLDPIIAANSGNIVTTRKQKVKKDDITIPRSLFDRPSAAILKMRREAKLQRVKGLIGGSNLHKSLPAFGALKQAAIIVNKPNVDVLQDNPEWLVQEDWALLQVIQTLQGLPLPLTIVQPAHVPNWDLTADAVNSLCRVYRSPKQCRLRYETIIVPREEGKILYDPNPKKQKKTKGIYKTKSNRPMRTSQLYVQDNNASFTSLALTKCEAILAVAKRRAPVIRQMYNQTAKNPRQAALLAENGINYDQPLTPVQVAAIRAERIAREKSKNQVPQPAVQSVVQATEQPLPVQRQQVQAQLTPTVAVASSTNIMQQQAQDVIARLAQGQLQNATIAAFAPSTLRANPRTTVTTAAGTTSTITVQEMVAAAAAGQVRNLTAGTVTSTSVTPSVVSVSGLTAVQLQAASQRLTASALPATTVTTALTQLSPQVAAQRNLTQLAQLQSYRQNAALLRQREQQKQQLKRFQAAQQQQQQAAQGVAGKLTVGATPTAQQRVAQQQASIKQAVGRTMTEAEMAQLVKRQQQKAQLTTAQILAQAQLQQQAQQQQSQQQQVVTTCTLQASMATLVKTVTAPSLGSVPAVTIPVSAIPSAGVNITIPQSKAGGAAKRTTTITNQQLRQIQLQQQLILQAGKNSKVTNLSQLAKVQGKSASALANQLNTVQIIQQGGQGTSGQQTKNLQTAMTVQIQQAMKQAVMPQTIPVVVTATPTLTASLQSQASLRGEPGIVASIKPQMTTLPATTLTTSSMLKGGPTVVVGQQQTAAILQQVAASSTAGLTAQQAVTLAVRAAASQAQGQPQVQIQVQQSPHASLVAQQSSVVTGMQTTQARIQQMSIGQTPISITQTAAQQSAVLGSSISADTTLQSPTHVVMQTSNPQATTSITMPAAALSTATATAQVVQAAIQAARQQQAAAAAAAAQQSKASPYTMRLRNPK